MSNPRPAARTVFRAGDRVVFRAVRPMTGESDDVLAKLGEPVINAVTGEVGWLAKPLSRAVALVWIPPDADMALWDPTGWRYDSRTQTYHQTDRRNDHDNDRR